MNKNGLTETSFQILDTIHHMMKEVIETIQGESVVYIETVGVEIGGYNRRRLGYIVLTSSRAYFVGPENIADTTYSERYYIMYPDISEQTFYGSLDYISLDSIKTSKLNYSRRENKIELELNEVDYVKMKPRYLFGPLFFKARLDDKKALRRGPFRIVLHIPKPDNQSTQDHRLRYERVLSHLKREGLGPSIE